ncbi:MAG: glycosyltransferase family 4 protein [Lachnospiraceae bacterium]|nr:glycosyltransferase family 4 protein [Lachnospiraceae bacterium]
MKILFVATVRSHIGQFHMPFIQYLVAQGHEVHAAFKDNSKDKKGLDLSGISKTFEIPFERSPLRKNNITAYKELKKVIYNGNYDIIHCHTPMGAVITRLAAIKARNNGTKVYYTAHGFHFFKGAPKHYWMMFYPVEKLLAHFTDCLILINDEDYRLVTRKHFKAKKIVKTHGVGVDINKFNNMLFDDKTQLRKKMGFPEDMFALIYPADLSDRKNQDMLFKTVALLKNKIPEIILLLPGQPIKLEEYKKICYDYGIEENVVFLGYRRDIPELLAISDISVSSSRQEGLPINLVEAMSMKKPIIATRVRGNEDLVVNGKGGYLITLNDSETMSEKILYLYENRELLSQMGVFNKKNAELFSVENVITELSEVYGI